MDRQITVINKLVDWASSYDLDRVYYIASSSTDQKGCARGGEGRVRGGFEGANKATCQRFRHYLIHLAKKFEENDEFDRV